MTMRLKICYLVPRIIPGEGGVIVGGCVNNCISVAQSLRGLGAEVEILAPVQRGKLNYLKQNPAFELITPITYEKPGELGAREGLFSLWLLYRELRIRASQAFYDVVHTHSGTFPYAAVSSSVRGEFARIHSLYCPLGLRDGAYSKWWERGILARLIFGKLDRVVAVSEDVRQTIAAIGMDLASVVHIPMCVDNHRFQPKATKRDFVYFRNNPKSSRVLFVGNASREKGLYNLVKAVGLLRKSGYSLNLVAAIENQNNVKSYQLELEKIKKEIRRKNLEECIQIIGLVTTIVDLYAESDVVVIPWTSTRGPSDYPMVALEAMAMAKCVVSTPVGGCKEIFRNKGCGIITKDPSPLSIAAELRRCIESPEMQQRTGAKALEISKIFSSDTVARSFVDFYERLLTLKSKGQ